MGTAPVGNGSVRMMVACRSVSHRGRRPYRPTLMSFGDGPQRAEGVRPGGSGPPPAEVDVTETIRETSAWVIEWVQAQRAPRQPERRGGESAYPGPTWAGVMRWRDP